MKHYFTVEIAQKYGVNAAIILEHLCFWQQKNMANKKHFYDGKYWTYCSIKAFHEILPYLSEKQIRTAINKLKKEKVIFVANYNKVKYDQTHWYSVDNSIFQKVIFHFAKRANGKGKRTNGNTEKGEPIPDNITDNIPDNITDKKEKEEDISKVVAYRDNSKKYTKNYPTPSFFEKNNKDNSKSSKESNLALTDIEKLTNEQYLEFIEQEFEKIPKKIIERWKKQYPNADVEVEMLKALDWLKDHPKKRRKDVKRFITNWLKKVKPAERGFQFQLVL